MEINIIDLKSSDIPCRKKLTIKDETFLLDIKYRGYDERLVVDLYDEFENILGVGEKLVFGVPVFYYMLFDTKGNYNAKFPKQYIIPWSEDGKEKEINLENLGKEWFLGIFDI
ncbi:MULTISPECIES: phage baseplate plug family protein [Fusobacterium]|uniref:phage baseplate plug family protein n=1 Tax=Fusobacterium TaxID=848 RepID=UPI000E9927E1|nr:MULTISPECIES: hypothetical protein [Fusobacterium]HBJ79727.1 hypothetical protein [Fusobacterium sp.]